jgi:hypothetical protein
MIRTVLALAVLLSTSVALAEPPDPTLPGPHQVTTDGYDLPSVNIPLFPGQVEMTGSVNYPTNLAAGPFPLVVLMHGRHSTCYQGESVALEWPCSNGRLPIESYKGYEYFAKVLASHGYVVVSVGANGINARDNATTDAGMQARAKLIQLHLDLWKKLNTTGAAPFGDRFQGRVDLQNVGTMGHSRGGEGVVTHYVLNQSLGSPYGVKAVLPLAPVDFNRKVADTTPLAVILPYCDGDVSDLQGVHFYDDARYAKPGDPGGMHTILMMGANHNFYNTNWTPEIFSPGSVDDWNTFADENDPHCGSVPNNGRLTSQQQRDAGLAYMAAFFRVYLGGERELLPYLTGDARPPAVVGSDEIHIGYHPPDVAGSRLDVNRLLNAGNLQTNTLGGAVTMSGLSPHDLCGGDAPQPRHCMSGNVSRLAHTTQSWVDRRGLSQLRTGWSSGTGSFKNALPAANRNVSGFKAIQFRASINFGDPRSNPHGTATDLRVVLTDGAGQTAWTQAANWSRSLYYPPGSSGTVPHSLLNTVRVPLTAFTGVNLQDIRSVELSFVERDSGALLISDLAFAD